MGSSESMALLFQLLVIAFQFLTLAIQIRPVRHKLFAILLQPLSVLLERLGRSDLGGDEIGFHREFEMINSQSIAIV